VAGEAVAGPVALTGTTRLVENMGHSSFWYGDLKGGGELIARLDKQVLLVAGGEVRFSLDPANLYLFDMNGAAIERLAFRNDNLSAQAKRK
jgi:hypothetical protein